jgi:ATP-dependent Clp protease ATP-binding subunit ClpA
MDAANLLKPALAILRALREPMEKHHGVALDDAALRAAVW